MQESKEKWINKKVRTVAAYRSTESWAAALALKLAASFMAKNTLISTRDTCGFRMLVCMQLHQEIWIFSIWPTRRQSSDCKIERT